MFGRVCSGESRNRKIIEWSVGSVDTVWKENKSLRRFFAFALVLLMVLSNLSPFVGTAAAEETEAQSDKLLLDRASTWKYLDDGSNQGQHWKEKDFNDSDMENVVLHH